MRTAKVALGELVLDWNLYPRTQISDVMTQNLAEAMRAGDTLPPIVVEKASMRIVDGFHRYTAHKRLKLDTITVELREYPNEAALFADMVSLNARHGRPLNPYDQKRIVLKAEQFGLEREAVADMLRIRPARVDELKREAATFHGESVPLKRGLGHLAGTPLTDRQVRLNTQWGGMNVTFYLRQLTDFIEAGCVQPNRQEFISAMDRLVALWAEMRPVEEAEG